MIQNFNLMALADQAKALQELAKGSIHTVVYRKQVVLSPTKFPNVTIETESVIQVRFNLEYGDNIARVREFHENGGGYGVLKGFAEVIEDLLYQNISNGRMAFRAFPFNGGKHSKKYFLNGVETSLDDLLAQGFPKSKLVSSGDDPSVMALYADNILEVR